MSDATIAAQIRAGAPVRTRGRAFGSLFDRWSRPALSRGVALTNPEDSTDGTVVSVRFEDGSVLPYGVDDLEPAPPSRPDRGPLASASDADVAREFWRRFAPDKVMFIAKNGRPAYAERDPDNAGGLWVSGMFSGAPRTQEHASGEDGFVAAIERARELARSEGWPARDLRRVARYT